MIKLESEKKGEGEEKTMRWKRLKRLPNSSPTHYFSWRKKNGSFESTEDEFPRQKQMITSLIYDNTLLLFVCGLCIKVNGNFWKYNIRFRLTLQLLVKFFFVKNSRSDISLETKLQQTLKKYILWFVILSVK